MMLPIQYPVEPVLALLTAELKTEYPDIQAQAIAWQLISHVTGKSRATLMAARALIPDTQLAVLRKMVETHLLEDKPIAYIIGSVHFGELLLTIRPPILIPRTETEMWCYKLIDLLKPFNNKHLRILDLCTGSGCIALALAHTLPQATVVGIDINQQALALAEENKQKTGIANCFFIKSDLFKMLAGEHFDIIVANPPYIGEQEKNSLSTSVLNFESPQALFAENGGYAIIETIITQAPNFLRHNDALTHANIPQLLIEIGYTQAERVKTFMHDHNYANITIWKDYQDHNRVVCAQVSPYGFQQTSTT